MARCRLVLVRVPPVLAMAAMVTAVMAAMLIAMAAVVTIGHMPMAGGQQQRQTQDSGENRGFSHNGALHGVLLERVNLPQISGPFLL